MKLITAVIILVALILALSGAIYFLLIYDVDKPPVTQKFVDSEDTYYITENTIFEFVATDEGSGVDTTLYRWWNNNTWTNWIEYTEPFNISGSGLIYMEFYSIDLAGNKEDIHNQSHYIDDIPPHTEKIIHYEDIIQCKAIIVSDEYDLTLYCNEIIIEQ